jgi:Putative serine esterase (DUF676)
MIIKTLALSYLLLGPAKTLAQETSLEGLKYYTSCHHEYDQTLDTKPKIDMPALAKKYNIALDNENFLSFTKVMGAENFLRFKERENDPTQTEVIDFLKTCTDKTSQFDREIGMLASEAYDISFVDRNNPKLENKRKGAPPKGYLVAKYYGNTPECYDSGFKAAKFAPDKGDYVVFAITGTESRPTYSSGVTREQYKTVKHSVLDRLRGKPPVTVTVSAKEKDQEDWLPPPVGKNQLATSCAKELILDAIADAQNANKKIIFTAHSLGGAISQAMSYKVEEALSEANTTHSPVKTVTFMSAGGRGHIKNINPAIEVKLDNVTYTSLGDLVPTTGSHISEVRIMKRTKEAEDDFINSTRAITNTHLFELSRFSDLKESKHVSYRDYLAENNQYTREFAEKRAERSKQKKNP